MTNAIQTIDNKIIITPSKENHLIYGLSAFDAAKIGRISREQGLITFRNLKKFHQVFQHLYICQASAWIHSNNTLKLAFSFFRTIELRSSFAFFFSLTLYTSPSYFTFNQLTFDDK